MKTSVWFRPRFAGFRGSLARALLCLVLSLAFTARSAAQCDPGQIWVPPQSNPPIHHPAVANPPIHHDAVTHIEHTDAVIDHHDAVVVEHPAVTHTELDENGEPYEVEDSPAWTEVISEAYDVEISPARDDIVVDVEARDEPVPDTPEWDEPVADTPGYCRDAAWESFEEISGWNPAGEWLPDASTIPLGELFLRSRAIAQERRTGERSELGEERNVTSVAESGIESEPAYGTMERWDEFTEIFDTPQTEWTPDPSTVPAGQSFNQSRTVTRFHRYGERNGAGVERNVTTESGDMEVVQSNTGTGPADVWTDFSEVTSSVPVTAWGPAENTKPTGTTYYKTRTVDVTRRSGQRNAVGVERNVTTVTTSEIETDSASSTGSGPAGGGGGTTAQTITFPQPVNMLTTDGDLGIDLGATASSGLPVWYYVVSGNATIHNGRLYLLGSGNITLRAEQPGNSQYASAPSVERTFMVSRPRFSPSVASQTTSRSVWDDVNGDGILDEIIFPGTDRFTYTIELLPTPIQVPLVPTDFFAPFNAPRRFTPTDQELPSAFWFDWDWDPSSIDPSSVNFKLTFDYEAEPGWDYAVHAGRVEDFLGSTTYHLVLSDISFSGSTVVNGDRRIFTEPVRPLEFLDGWVFFVVRFGKAPVSPNWTLEGIAADPEPLRYYMADRPRFLSMMPAWNWDDAISRGDWDEASISDPEARFLWEVGMQSFTIVTPETSPSPVPTKPAPEGRAPLPPIESRPPGRTPTPIETAAGTVIRRAMVIMIIFQDIIQRIPISYVLYEKPSLTHPGTWYSGRTGPRIGNPAQVMARRDKEHDQLPDGRNVDHGRALIRAYIQTRGVVTRAFYASVGREQQMIDSRGGFVPPVNGVEAYKLGLTNSTNARREIAKDRFDGYIYWNTSNFLFGPLWPYTGDEDTKGLNYIAVFWPWLTGGQIIKVAPPAPLEPYHVW